MPPSHDVPPCKGCIYEAVDPCNEHHAKSCHVAKGGSDHGFDARAFEWHGFICCVCLTDGRMLGCRVSTLTANIPSVLRVGINVLAT